jgi:hypothetical protein
MATTGAHPQYPHPKRLPLEPNPVLVEHARQRAESVQNRVADKITTFAGSMAFVYISGSAVGSASASRSTRTDS